MNLILASDDNYAPFLGICLYSLLKSNFEDCNNAYEDTINVFIMDMEISELNKSRILEISKPYNCKVTYLNTSFIDNKLKQIVKAKVRSLSTYYRLFLNTLLPLDVDKVIYLDCDALVVSSLKELWETDIKDYDIGGVLDVISPFAKLKVGLSEDSSYLNAGLLLINLKSWRDQRMEEKFINFLISHNGTVFYHDQGTINAVCSKKKILHPKFNAMTPFFYMDLNQIKRFHDVNTYYSTKELKEAKDTPVFCHLTPHLVDRPWVNKSDHPLNILYKQFQKETPWYDLNVKSDSTQLKPWIKTTFKYLPTNLFIIIIRLIRKVKNVLHKEDV